MFVPITPTDIQTDGYVGSLGHSFRHSGELWAGHGDMKMSESDKAPAAQRFYPSGECRQQMSK